MVIYGIGCDSVQPVAKLLISTFETMKILNHFKKHFGRNILGYSPVKQPVCAVSEYRIVMFPIQLHEGCSIAASLNYQSPGFIHVCCTPEFKCLNYHHYCKCAPSKNAAKKIKNQNAKSKITY